MDKISKEQFEHMKTREYCFSYMACSGGNWWLFHTEGETFIPVKHQAGQYYRMGVIKGFRKAYNFILEKRREY